MVVLGSGGKGGGGEPEITFSLVSNLWKWKRRHLEMMCPLLFYVGPTGQWNKQHQNISFIVHHSLFIPFIPVLLREQQGFSPRPT